MQPRFEASAEDAKGAAALAQKGALRIVRLVMRMWSVPSRCKQRGRSRQLRCGGGLEQSKLELHGGCRQ